jgi:protein-S-isoprenylcysteine O-methyltransferase Ste14
MMSHEWILQCGVLYVPILCAALLLALSREEARHPVALLFALTWQAAMVPVVDFFCQKLGFWSYGGTRWWVLDMPLAFHFGWVVWWGAVMPLLYECLVPHTGKIMAGMLVVAMALTIDLVGMPRLAPVLLLSKHWWLGECLMCGLVLMPGILLHQLTRHSILPLCRGLMIALAFALLVLWVLPVSTMETMPVLSEKRWIVFVMVLLLALLPGVWAVVLFGTVGQGTPIPFDPPQRLVTVGIYRWMANPMQTSILLAMLVVAWFLSHSGLCIAALSTWVYSIGIARWSESMDLTQRFGESWLAYRQRTPNWLPLRWRKRNDQ